MPKGSRVLMADDDKMLIDMYKERLELAGYVVSLCRNGEEALNQVRESKPDIVLLDIMMPKLNGYEALASIKSDPATKDIPVIMLSALMRDFNREKAVEAGADDYLIKSEAMPADVIQKIEQVLTKYGKGLTPAPGPNIPAPSAISPIPPVNPVPTSQTVPPPPPPAPLPPVNQVFSPTPSPMSNPVPSNPINSTPVATPAASVMQPDVENKPVFESAPPPTDPKPEPKTEEQKKEEVPLVTLNSKPEVEIKVHAPAPTMAWEAEPDKDLNQKKEKSPANIALIVVAAILLTALINDVVIYFFFLKK